MDPSNPVDLERYLVSRRLIAPNQAIETSRAGDGNMNLTLRIIPAGGRSFILKQGRPWVEKYPQIAAPPERTLVEAAFYAEVHGDPDVARGMPAVLDVDPDEHILVMEDVGSARDFTSIYADGEIPNRVLRDLLDWLERLSTLPPVTTRRGVFANRAMRALNHEHIFDFPLRRDNGLDLDGITAGLSIAARELAGDRGYVAAVEALGRRYLADGETLVHGDYFPGSWLRCEEGMRIIDPEFCFLGDAQFDCGTLVAHLLLAQCSAEVIAQTISALDARGLNLALVSGYSGVEIMRRLIGVAQLPLTIGIERKRALLTLSRRLVVEPDQGFT